ncbi:hypothetical protein sscle_04g036530 [Sclerotinia sclerotiorum 1980 UF-70]|nr:hypothetical protein sscle_04g036530 [Sclerotinia sclerotiorum 1980 UF-70]
MEPKQTVSEKFTCNICGKDCGNRKSQLRHIFYCRRVKAQGGVKSRKRSCVPCTKAKTQCDLRQRCSRCTTKNLSCVYEGPRILETNVPKPVAGKLLENGTNQVAGIPFVSSSSDVATSALMDVHETAISPYALQSSDINIQDILSLDLPGENWDVNFSDFLPEHTGFPSLGSAPYYIQSSPQLLQPEPSPISTNFHLRGGLPYYRMYNQPVPKAPIAFAPRKSPRSQFSLNRKHILCTLPTYPSMMLPSNSDIPPPFIHPHFNDRNSLSGALGVCASLVRWTSHKTEDNAVHIWRCIRMEINRLCAEYSIYNEEDAVAALQAMTVYFLLRLSEDNEEATSFDAPLIYTMIKVATHAINLANNISNDSIPSWKKWVLAESLRRTIIIIFFIDLFFDLASGIPDHQCDGNNLLRLALPCSRKLWRATTNEAWENEYLSTIRSNPLTYGHLINYQSRPEDHSLDEWLSQLDEFGTLVLAAATPAS